MTWTESRSTRFCKIDSRYCDSQVKMLIIYLTTIYCDSDAKSNVKQTVKESEAFDEI